MNEIKIDGVICDEPRTGTSEKGTAWASINIKNVVADGDREFSTFVGIKAFGDLAKKLFHAKLGDTLKVAGRLAADKREKDDRTWYEKVIKAEKVALEAGTAPPPAPPQEEMTFEPDDELPF